MLSEIELFILYGKRTGDSDIEELHLIIFLTSEEEKVGTWMEPSKALYGNKMDDKNIVHSMCNLVLVQNQLKITPFLFTINTN